MLVITPQRGSQPRVQHHPVATPEDSALYPLRCFSAPFATDAETFGYLQVQHLFADSFFDCPLAIRTADHKWTMLAKFNVVAYGDGDGGAGSGIRTRVTSLEDWCINPYTMPA